MVKEIKLAPVKIDQYSKIVGADLISEIKKLAGKLKRKKIIHINATEQGGGVSEILKSLVPLMTGLGLDVRWFVIRPDPKFFEITNQIHDALQGATDARLSFIEKYIYKRESKKLASDFKNINADIWIAHDPQPLAIFSYLERQEPKILRFHIDLSAPNKKIWRFIFPFTKNYEKIVFSAQEFINKEIAKEKIEIFQPAIDPLKEKNKLIPLEAAHLIFVSHGINPSHPIITQISRFDRWKDPVGVMKAYYIAKKEIPALQLVLCGLCSAKDNPNSKDIYRKVIKHSRGDKDIFAFYDPKKVSAEEATLVNAFQSGADVVIQKSLKEGFGLTVTEAMWKAKPVIGGKAGGIKLQIRNGYNGFLVASPEECAEKVIWILKNKTRARLMGRHARETVRNKFLIPRLLRDYLLLIKKIKV